MLYSILQSSMTTRASVSDQYRVTMTIDGSQISGRAACNSYGGAVSIDNGVFSLGEIAQTEMGCEPAVMEIESKFMQGLFSVTGAARSGDTASLTGDGVEYTFELVPPVRLRIVPETLVTTFGPVMCGHPLQNENKHLIHPLRNDADPTVPGWRSTPTYLDHVASATRCFSYLCIFSVSHLVSRIANRPLAGVMDGRWTDQLHVASATPLSTPPISVSTTLPARPDAAAIRFGLQAWPGRSDGSANFG